MVKSAETVSRSVESIAAVSQENSAAAEEESAATQKVTAQVAKVVSSAPVLADTTTHLDAIAARFHLDGVEAAGTATVAETCSEPPRPRGLSRPEPPFPELPGGSSPLFRPGVAWSPRGR